MATPKLVQFSPEPIERFRPMLGDQEFARIVDIAERARQEFAGRAIWHVNSTMRGGGVAEILYALLPYVRGAKVDTRWVVLRESTEFFALTKRLHNNLHGVDEDGAELGKEERDLYESTLGATGRQLAELIQPGDILFLHDPQTLGLVEAGRAAGAKVIWRCHIGVDEPNEVTRRAWDFLTPFVQNADAFVFSRAAYIWETLDRDRVWIMPPSIDPFSPKNQDLDAGAVASALRVIGLADGGRRKAPVFARADGTPGRVERAAEILQEGALGRDAHVVLQVSRWDRLKDHRGLIECFDRYIDREDVHLVLAGPASGAVADDPEGSLRWAEIVSVWPILDESTRRRLHVVSLPMVDLDENAAVVNALQRRAEVVVQKSLAEGFGLTVAEAMWKGKPVVGSRVGGIQDQIVDGVSGVLIDDPRDLRAFAGAISALVDNPEEAMQIGEAAHERIRDHYLAAGRLVEYVTLIAEVVADDPQASISR